MRTLISLCAGAVLLLGATHVGHAQTGTLTHQHGWTRHRSPGSVSLWTSGSLLGLGGARLGVQVQAMTDPLRAYFGAPAGTGVLVTDVDKNAPGASAGLRPGDVILSVDGKPVTTAWEIIRQLARRSAGDRVKLEIVRDKKRRSLTATLKKPGHPAMPAHGLSNLKAALQALKKVDALKHFNIQIPDVDASVFSSMKGTRNRALRKQLRDTQKQVRDLERRLQALEQKRGK